MKGCEMLIHKCFQLLGLFDCLPWNQGVYNCDWLLWWLQCVLHGLPRHLRRTYCLLHTIVLSHHEMLRDIARYHSERREFITNLVAMVVKCKHALFLVKRLTREELFLRDASSQSKRLYSTPPDSARDPLTLPVCHNEVFWSWRGILENPCI